MGVIRGFLAGRGWTVSLLAALGAGLPSRTPAAGDTGAGSVRAEAYYAYLMAHRALGQGDYEASADLLERTLRADPDADFLHLEIAEVQLLEGEPDRAEEILGRYLERRPDDAAGHLLLAQVHLRQIGLGRRAGHVDRAIEAYLQAIRLRPDDEEGVLELGNLYRNVGRTAEAMRILEDFCSRHPDSNHVNLLLAGVLLQVRESDRAEQLLRENLLRDPADLETADRLADLYERQERYEDAIDLYNRAGSLLEPNHFLFARLGYLNLLAKRYPAAVENLDRARRLAPGNEGILVNLAKALEEAGDLPGAMEVYRELLQLSPTNRSVRYHLARLQAQFGRFEDALSLYRDLAAELESEGEVSPEAAESVTICYIQIGRLFLRRDRPEEAVAAFQKAMKYSAGERMDAHLLLGRAYLEAGSFDLLWRVLPRAESRFPGETAFALLRGEGMLREGRREEGLRFLRTRWQDPAAGRDMLLQLAEILVERGEYGEAGELLELGLHRFPGDDMMLFQMGTVQERKGSAAAAEEFFRRALAVNPDNPLVLNSLGYMLVEQGARLEESLGYIRRAVELDRYNPDYLDSLGWAYFKLDRLEQARDHLEEAARLAAGDPVIEDHLGDAYHRLGRIGDAIAAWGRALQAGSPDPAGLEGKIRKARAAGDGSP